MGYYKITEWMPGMWRITSPECVYEELMIGTEKALLLDTGWGTGQLKKVVREITDKPLIVVNSHGHIDHVNGNMQFDEPIYIHPADVELCKAHSSRQMRQMIASAAEKLTPPEEKFNQEAFLSGRIGKLTPLEEGEVFDLGGKTLEVIALPGHTQGSIGLMYREEKILFVGGAINGAMVLYLPECGNIAQYIATLEKTKKLDFTRMVQSHNNKIVDREALNIYLSVAQRVDWEAAEPYVNNGNVVPNVRIMCREGLHQQDILTPDFAGIIFSKDKL